MNIYEPDRNADDYLRQRRRERSKARYKLPPQISTDDYWELLQRQGGRCAICRDKCRLHLDHCHDTGFARGLLCVACNTALGSFGDTVEGLRRAVAYLRQFDPSAIAEVDPIDENDEQLSVPNRAAKCCEYGQKNILWFSACPVSGPGKSGWFWIVNERRKKPKVTEIKFCPQCGTNLWPQRKVKTHEHPTLTDASGVTAG